MFALKSNHYKNGLEIKTTVIKTIEDVLAISKAEIPGDFLELLPSVSFKSPK